MPTITPGRYFLIIISHGWTLGASTGMLWSYYVEPKFDAFVGILFGINMRILIWSHAKFQQYAHKPISPATYIVFGIAPINIQLLQFLDMLSITPHQSAVIGAGIAGFSLGLVPMASFFWSSLSVEHQNLSNRI